MKYLIGFFVTVGLIILLIVLLVSGGDTKTKVPNSSKSLDSYASSAATARLTIDGPVSAPQNHYATRITVGRDSTTYEELQGYDGNVIKTQTYPNTQTSYTSFLRAIELAGFTKGDTAASLKNDRGYCALGSRYIFEFVDSGKQLERFWSTSCAGPKSFQGKTNLTLSLFKKQVPDYNKLVDHRSFSFDL
ncbi:MAG: hypothetical protein QFB87_00415 [Patescibacteria group bacterium]|nr:hypothetical protein [Patescibacteria group bacterium]